MTDHERSSNSSFLGAVGRVLRFLIRLVFVLIVGALIGLGLFYGVPYAYRRLMWPVQENSARVAILEEQVAKNSDSIFNNRLALEDRISDLEEEVAELRDEGAARAQNQEALEREIEQLAGRVSDLEDDLRAQQKELEEADLAFSETASHLTEEIDMIGEQLADARQELSQEIEASQEGVEALGGKLDEAAVRLLFLQTAQDLLKVRLLLVEDNPGTARETLALAVEHLEQAGGLVPEQEERVEDLRDRMLAVDDLIANRSFRARPSLEALWADLMGFVTPLSAGTTVTGTQGTSPVPTPTP